MLTRKLTEVEELQTKFDESEWSLSDDSALCHVLEKYRDYYSEHVEKLEHEIAKISQLAALLNSGVGHLNGTVIHVANSRFIHQHLAEDANSEVLAVEEVTKSSTDGRADTVATLSAAIRQGISATNRWQNMDDLCSTRPVIGSQSFRNSLLSRDSSIQTPSSGTPTSRVPVSDATLPYFNRALPSSASNESLAVVSHSRIQSRVTPLPVNSKSDIQPQLSIPSSNSSIRSLTYDPEPKSEEASALSVNNANESNGDTSTSLDQAIDVRGFTHIKNNVLYAPKGGSNDDVPSVNDCAQSANTNEDKSKSSPLANFGTAESHVGLKDSGIQRESTAEEKGAEKDHQERKAINIERGSHNNARTTQSITKKYASIFDSDSDDEALFVDPGKPLLSSGTGNDAKTMKKVQIPKKLESTAFSKMLTDKLAKGPTPSRARGPIRRPPSRMKPGSAIAKADVLETPSQGSKSAAVIATEASSSSNLPSAGEAAVSRKDKSAVGTKRDDQASLPTTHQEEFAKAAGSYSSVPRANASKAIRSFFDSESDEENGAGDNSSSDGHGTFVLGTTAKAKASAHKEPPPENPSKSSASAREAPAQKSTKPQFGKGLFDDDEEDSDLSLFRSKPKGTHGLFGEILREMVMPFVAAVLRALPEEKNVSNMRTKISTAWCMYATEIRGVAMSTCRFEDWEIVLLRSRTSATKE
ncbi:hypothetical protein GCK32_000401 [Trichostrongylus colubriformis]|uniref:Uncharacterized protein n=1 Tax=Trichostrongylus colubriformis TaxID=6319 RepID=A0AAN8F5A0_TRICO